ncbi:MAG: hypothetical protein HFE68_07025 [Erysipelotrichaceae bacterium]|nr:hypothetical protein [Erysipelotrichaceae bacterium]MCI9313099.1 hypothetical protein [Erysipelotrichaceae bacterium]
MTDEKINKIAGCLWGGKFENIDFNMRKNEINLNICMHYATGKEFHCLSFIGVSTFYYVNDSKKYRTQISDMEPEYDFDFTSLNYVENIKIDVSHHTYDWMERYSAEVNVYIEVWEKVLFIECTGMKLDGKIYNFSEE